MPATNRILVVVPMAPGDQPIRMATYAAVAQLQWPQPLDVLWLRDDQPDKPHVALCPGRIPCCGYMYRQ